MKRQPLPAPDVLPELWVDDWPLPPYRYVPGLQPHPFRHEGGHSFVGGQAPEPTPWTEPASWREDRLFLRGVDLFNCRFYWEAHEQWEGVWHQVQRPSLLAELLQAGIQASAFVLKTHMGQLAAASRLHDVTRGRLQQIKTSHGAHFYGVDLAALQAQLHTYAQTGAWPLIRLE